MPQARQLSAWVQSYLALCDIYGAQNGTGASFSLTFFGFLLLIIALLPCNHHISIP
jgi:hypothetical protein